MHRTSFCVCATALTLAVPASTARGQDLVELDLAALLNVRAVAGARHDQRIVDSPRAITVVTAEQIRSRNYRTTPEALSELAGVFVQQTNDGAGAPIVRGLIGNQILILVDGIRLNTGAYRLGPNQYLNTIDVNQIERIEVVRGAGSVLYGSDAVGGIVNIVTRSAPDDGTPALRTRFFSRLSSANTGMVGRAELAARTGRLGVIGGLTIKDFGQLRGGRTTGVQALTGYDEWDGDLKLAYRLSPTHLVTLGTQRVNQRNVHRRDLVQSGTDLKMTWDPETRALTYATYAARDLGTVVDQVNLTVSYQRQTERYVRISAAAPLTERHHFDATESLGATAQFASSIGPRHLLTYGFDAYRDDITSLREDVSLRNGSRSHARGTLSDGADYRSLGAFVQDEIDVSPRVHLNLATRYSAFRPHATVGDASTRSVVISGAPQALTGTAYALFRLTSGMDVVGGVAQGFRSPNIDDLTVLGPFGGGYEVPNARLRPETSVNWEVGLRGRSLRFSGGASFFVSHFDDLIQRGPGTFLGLAFRDFDANGVRSPSEPLVYQRQNVGRARIHGVELEGQWRVGSRWTIAGTLARLIGEELPTRLPLRRMPPAHGTARARWATGRLWVEGYSMFATHQSRLAAEDRSDVRVPPGGTRGFLTLHTRGGIDLRDALRLTLGVENLTNETYRIHGSGVDMPGPNVVLGVEWGF